MAKKITIDDMHELAAKNDGKCLSTEYLDENRLLEWQCKNLHIWSLSYVNIQRRLSKDHGWCLDCYFSKKFPEATSFNINKYCFENNLNIIDIIKINNKFELECKTCNKIWQTCKNNIIKNKFACRKCFINKNRKYFINDNAFENEDDVSFYLLGVWYSDGNVLHRKKYKTKISTLTSIDKEWVEKIRDALVPDKPIIKKNNRNYYELAINSNKFYDWLVKWGCVENKSLIIKYPTNIPDKYLPDFIRGLIDGDGSVYVYNQTNKINNTVKKHLQMYLCGASKNLIKSVNDQIEEIGFKTSFQTKISKKGSKIMNSFLKKDSIIYRVVISGKSASDLLEWLYYPGHKISLERKRLTSEEGILITKERVAANGHLY